MIIIRKLLLMVALSFCSVKAQHIVKMLSNYVLIDTDVGIGRIHDKITIQRKVGDYIINVGVVQIVKFRDGKTAAKIVKEFHPFQIGDFVEDKYVETASKITKAPSQNYVKTETREGKSPTVAFLLSFILTGAGQYYNGDVKKGVIQELLVIGGYVLAFEVGTEDGEWPMGLNPWFYIGLGIAAGSHIWSVIDAPLSADKINKRRHQYYGHLFELQNNSRTLGFDLGPNKGGFCFHLSYHF